MSIDTLPESFVTLLSGFAFFGSSRKRSEGGKLVQMKDKKAMAEKILSIFCI